MRVNNPSAEPLPEGIQNLVYDKRALAAARSPYDILMPVQVIQSHGYFLGRIIYSLSLAKTYFYSSFKQDITMVYLTGITMAGYIPPRSFLPPQAGESLMQALEH